MKTNNILFLCFFSLLLWTSCEDSGDKYYLLGLEESDLIVTTDKVVLTQDNSSDIVLSLAWTKGTLSVSNNKVSAPDVYDTSLEISSTKEFSSLVEVRGESLSIAFTGKELNAIAKELGVIPDVATPIYFRLKGSIGNNIPAVYSAIKEISLVSYEIDMSRGLILDKEMNDTGLFLFSENEDGIYRGFMGATAWANFYMQEGNGTTWGNDGVDGDAFLLSSEDDPEKRWNLWFPSVGGSYYVTVDTQKKLWSALNLPEINITGDLSAQMEFDRSSNSWSYSFTADEAKEITVSLSGVGKLFDYSTGDQDENLAISTPFGFQKENNELIFAEEPSNFTLAIPEAGECTLILDLSNPLELTCSLVAGTIEPEVVNSEVYLPGIDDLLIGGWKFESKLSLFNEDDLSYAGVVNVDSEFGYGIYLEKDNWDDFYKLDSGDELDGKLLNGAEDNIPAPAKGTYFINVSLKSLKYSVLALTEKVYVSGLNDSWDFNTTLEKTQNDGIYSGVISITKPSEYGFQIHIDDSWNNYFGGVEGKLYYTGDNLKEDQTLDLGEYILTVDFISESYEITAITK